MSSAGAQAVVVARPLPCCWPCRPSAWASIGLIWAISSCALRRSWNGSHRVMVAIWSPSLVGRAARRLGENADRVVDRRSLTEPTYSIVNTVQCQDRRSDEVNMREGSVPERAKTPPSKRATATSGEPATDGRSRSLWFNAPMNDQDRRPPLTRQRVVAEALTVIAQDGVQALTMRTLAARLGVVPGALYHHVRNKEQLHDLVLDAALAEVDGHLDPSQPWTQQIKLLAHRLRDVLENHPGVAALLKTRDPLGPHSLALAEAILAPLHAAGFGDHQAGLAFFLLVDHTTGFAVSPPTAVNEQRVRDAATRTQLHEFFRSPPTASPPWSPSAPTSGSTTATSGSPPAWTSSSTGWSTRGAPPTDRRSQDDRPPPLSDHVKKHDRRWMNDPQGR